MSIKLFKYWEWATASQSDIWSLLWLVGWGLHLQIESLIGLEIKKEKKKKVNYIQIPGMGVYNLSFLEFKTLT